MSPTGPKVSHRNMGTQQRSPSQGGKPRRPAMGVEGGGASVVVGARESRVQGEGRQGAGTHLEPEEWSVDSDQQANMAWLLSVRQKCTSRAGTALRLYHDSWRAGCVSKGARPVRREIMGNRRRQRRTAPTIPPTRSLVHGCCLGIAWRFYAFYRSPPDARIASTRAGSSVCAVRNPLVGETAAAALFPWPAVARTLTSKETVPGGGICLGCGVSTCGGRAVASHPETRI